MFDLLIFDLDGTLIDSKLDLAKSVNAMRDWMGLPHLERDRVYSYVGNGAPVLVRRALGPGLDDGVYERALRYFLDYYNAHPLDHTVLYPGVREGLGRFHSRGMHMGVLTNKPARISTKILSGLGVGDYFLRIYGGDSLEKKKPDPEGVDRLIEEAGVARERALLIGDSSVDVQTARNAGVRVVCVTYGFQPESLAEHPPDLAFDEFSRLADWVLEGG